MWLITNINLKQRSPFLILQCKDYSVYADKHIYLDNQSESFFLSNGHVCLKGTSISDPGLDETNLKKILDNKKSFISNIKGIFTIALGDQNGFDVYVDRFGQKKCFYYLRESRFIISDSLHAIIKLINPTISIESIAVYALGYHYIGGKTIFMDIKTILPGSFLQYKEGFLTESTYWTPKELLSIEQGHVDIHDLASELERVIKQSLTAVSRGSVSLSITAGIDSRILLSILMKLGVEVHGYTYGNPSSSDCTIASEICSKVGIPHSIHKIDFTVDAFTKWARKSIELGSSVCSLHRAYRIAAIEREAEYADTMILGTMGGEFVKGANREDYIVSNFIYDYCKAQSNDVIIKYLKDKGIIYGIEKELVNRIANFFSNEKYIIDKDNMEMYVLCEISAGLHHGQNITQYGEYFNNILIPYLDIDYLELLFSSQYSFLYRRRSQPPTEYKLKNPMFGCKMQYHLNQKLSGILYGNGFSAKDYLFSSYYAGLKAKILRKTKKSPPNFPLENWFAVFAKQNLRIILESGSIIKELFDIDSMLDELNLPVLPKNESFWLKYTTPIQMFYTLQSYGVE